MKKIIFLISFLIMGFIVNVNEANAYNYWDNKAKLTGTQPITDTWYWVNVESFQDVPYRSYIFTAVNDWNNKVEKTLLNKVDVEFTRHEEKSNSRADFYVGSYGNTGWNGIANFFLHGEGQINPTGIGPSKSYNYAEIKLNHSAIGNDPAALISATARHEFGHALGLAHSSELNAIMYKDRSRTTQAVTDDDVKGIKNLY